MTVSESIVLSLDLVTRWEKLFIRGPRTDLARRADTSYSTQLRIYTLHFFRHFGLLNMGFSGGCRGTFALPQDLSDPSPGKRRENILLCCYYAIVVLISFIDGVFINLRKDVKRNVCYRHHVHTWKILGRD